MVNLFMPRLKSICFKSHATIPPSPEHSAIPATDENRYSFWAKPFRYSKTKYLRHQAITRMRLGYAADVYATYCWYKIV